MKAVFSIKKIPEKIFLQRIILDNAVATGRPEKACKGS